MIGQKRDRAAANRAIREADWDSLRTRYEAGEPMRGLAAEAGIAVTTMRTRLGNHGTRMRTGTQPATLPISDTDLRTAYAAGETITGLARQYGCSISLIWRRLNFHTPPSRPTQKRPAKGPAANRLPLEPPAALSTALPTVLRMPDGRLPVGPICAEYTAGATLLVLAQRWQCSMSGIRSVLARGDVVMRPKRSRRPVDDAQIVDARDRRRLSWAEISAATGLTVEALLYRYTNAQGRQPTREWHRHPSQHPELDADQLQQLNSVIDHRDEIVAALLTGQASAAELAEAWGVSARTIQRWATHQRQHRRNSTAPTGFGRRSTTGHGRGSAAKHPGRLRPGTGNDKDEPPMAQRVTVLLEDDLDGTAADQTVAFSLDGTGYEIDLSNQHADQLRSALAPWITSARHVGGRRPSPRPSAQFSPQSSAPPVRSVGGTGPARTDKEQLDMIRRWANDNGHPVSGRGRIPATVRTAFDQAHPSR